MGVTKRVTVLARLRARRGMEEQVKRECLALVAPSRAEQGCINYDLHQSADDRTVFIFYENWESHEALERHLESQHSLQFDERTKGMLAEPEEITFWQMIS
ncbi:MAG: antibiotic biosynthesis monooxygenase [Acidobacteria bacterium 13_1_20CM_3_53_8]|nr:MAG: antibiotic biosynthesis monooxygenase [Acidobacteria bacterium 13_1_20CM_3_53_8]